MGIECDNRGDFDAVLGAIPEYLDRQIIRQLQYCGERCLTEARQKAGYITWSGNLISSTGYVVVAYGKIVCESSFGQVKEGKEGAEAGKSLAERLAKMETDGYCLIFVAGMQYAKYVQDRGYNVTMKSEMLAEKIVPIMLSKIRF